MAAAHEWHEDGGDDDGGAEHHQVVLERHDHRGDCMRQSVNQRRQPKISSELNSIHGYIAIINGGRTPWRRAGDAVVEAAKLLLDGERHQVLGLHGGHGAPIDHTRGIEEDQRREAVPAGWGSFAVKRRWDDGRKKRKQAPSFMSELDRLSRFFVCPCVLSCHCSSIGF